MLIGLPVALRVFVFRFGYAGGYCILIAVFWKVLVLETCSLMIDLCFADGDKIENYD